MRSRKYRRRFTANFAKAPSIALFKALQGQFSHDLKSGLWQLAGPTEAMLRDVQVAFSRLDASVFLRSLDALHLVTARAEGFTRIYSNDRHLLGACRRFKLVGVDPTR